MNIEVEVKQIMAEILEIAENEIDDDTAIGDLESWDSLSHLRIISAIEKKFEIQFTPDVLMELEDFSDIVKATKDRASR